jgi:hypothetical protein
MMKASFWEVFFYFIKISRLFGLFFFEVAVVLWKMYNIVKYRMKLETLKEWNF